MPTDCSHDVVAVIIGRAGSKGLPGKNSMSLPLLPDAKPVVAYSIDAARASASVSRIVVSTDCHIIRDVAERELVEVVRRPPHLASDTATVDAAVRDAIESVDDTSPVVVILYANVPVRPADLIDRAVSTLRETGADSVQSYCEVGKYHPHWMVTLNQGGEVKPHVRNSVYRRQDLPKLLIPDGGVIAVRRTSLFTQIDGEPHAFLGSDRRGIETEAGTVIDIDSPIDAVVAAAALLHTREAPGVPRAHR